MFNKILETTKLLQEKSQSNFIIYCENIYFTKLESKNKVAYEGLLTLCKFGQTLAPITPTKEGHKKDLAMSQGCIRAHNWLS
jgi:hypothetical protein